MRSPKKNLVSKWALTLESRFLIYELIIDPIAKDRGHSLNILLYFDGRCAEEPF